MKSKIFGLFGLSIFLIAILAVFTSAAVTYESVAGNGQTINAGNSATISFQLKRSEEHTSELQSH